MTRYQRGYVFEKSNAFHLRYSADEDGLRKQKSVRLCDKDASRGYGSTTAKAVLDLADVVLHMSEKERIEIEIARLQKLLAKINGVSSLTVIEFWKQVYQPHIEANLKHSTVKGYHQMWEQHLRPHFKKHLLINYTTAEHSLLLTSLSKTYGSRTISHIKFLASSMFTYAVASGHCTQNPIIPAKVLGRTAEIGTTKAYSLEEIENVISALKDHVDCQLIMALAFFLGLRKGEIAGLQWGDVDADYIHIRRAVGGGVVGTPKTRKSLRSVPLISPVRLLLRLHRNVTNTSHWMFPGRNENNPVCLDRKADLIRITLQKAGLPWKGFHAGRRGLGTTLRALTGNSNAGRDMLGHSNAQVTEAHYEAAMPEAVMVGMKLLEEKVKL